MSTTSTLLSNNNVQEMTGNYLNMEGGAWKSASQVGGTANAGLNPVDDELLRLSKEKKKKGFMLSKESKERNKEIEEAKKRVAEEAVNTKKWVDASKISADASSDTPLSAPRPNSNSTLTEGGLPGLGNNAFEFRQELVKLNPAYVFALLKGKNMMTVDQETGKVAFNGDEAANIKSILARMTAEYATYAVLDKDLNPDFKATADKYAGVSQRQGKDVDLSFLPVGGQGEYANHLPSSDFISGLPGALAIANYQPQRLMHPVMGASLLAQRGGGAIVYSNAPSVRKYCGDKNFLEERVNQQLETLRAKNINLTENSKIKVESMLRMLKEVESSLCVTYDKLDALIGSNGDKVAAIKEGEKKGQFELDDLNSNLSELKAKKRKLSGQALSTIMTLEEVITNAVRKGMDKEPTAAKTVKNW